MLSRKLRTAMAAAGWASGLEYVYSTYSETTTIQIPATAQVGDIAVICDIAIGANAPPTAVLPPTWSTAVNATLTAFNCRQVNSIRLLTSNNINQTITGMNGTTIFKDLVIFRKSPAATSFTYGGNSISANTWQFSSNATATSGNLVRINYLVDPRPVPRVELFTTFADASNFTIPSGFGNPANSIFTYKLFNKQSISNSSIVATGSETFRIISGGWIGAS